MDCFWVVLLLRCEIRMCRRAIKKQPVSKTDRTTCKVQVNRARCFNRGNELRSNKPAVAYSLFNLLLATQLGFSVTELCRGYHAFSANQLSIHLFSANVNQR